MRILLAVDPINDFFPGGALPVAGGHEIVPVINALAEHGGYDLCILVREEHPEGHVSFASSHAGGKVYDELTIGGVKQTLWPDHSKRGTHGAEYHPKLRVDLFQREVLKGTNKDIDSYSAFYDNARGSETALRGIIEAELARRGESRADVVVDTVGLALDYCVMASALDARSLGYTTRVLLDGTRAVNVKPGDDVRALRTLLEAGVEVVESRMRELRVERTRGRDAREQPMQP